MAGPQLPCGQLGREIRDRRVEAVAALGRLADRGADVVGVNVRVVPKRQHTLAERQVGHATRAVPHVVVDRVEQRARNVADRGAQAGGRAGGRLVADRGRLLVGVAASGDAGRGVLGQTDDVTGDVACLPAARSGRPAFHCFSLKPSIERGEGVVLVQASVGDVRAGERCGGHARES